MEHLGIEFSAGFQSLPRIDGSDLKEESDEVEVGVEMRISSAGNDSSAF